jgi:hypothetical protein
MSTTYPVDATIARAPVRRLSASLEQGTAESAQRNTRTFAKTVVIGVAIAAAAAAHLLVHIDNPSVQNPNCAYVANPHNSLGHPPVPRLAVERGWHTDRPPVLTAPIGTMSCDRQ